MTLQNVLADRLAEEDQELLSRALATAYEACNDHIRNCSALGNFYPGMTHRGYLLGIFAQYALDQAAASSRRFFSSVRPNSIRNHYHCQFEFPSGVHFESIYIGARADRRARKAVYRASLASVNGDLFEGCEAPARYEPHDPIYAHLLHGGTEQPISIALAIPNPDQVTYSIAPLILPVVPPRKAEVEQVAEAMTFGMKQTNNANPNFDKASNE